MENIATILIYSTHGKVRNAKHAKNSRAEHNPDAGRRRNPVFDCRNRDTSATSGIRSRLIKPLNKETKNKDQKFYKWVLPFH